MSRLCAIFVLTATLVSLTPEAAAGIGVLGDSYSDEYRFYPPHRSTARNWVEILASTRGLDFGAYSETSRGEPRNQGYAFNWARSDATTDDMIASGQHTGVAAQVARDEVGLVCVFVGGNDFINALRSADPYSAVEAAPLRAAANFRKAVRTVLDASRAVRLVVATLPDVRDLPEFNGPVRDGRLPDTLADACTASIRRYNCEIRAVAASDPRVALLDLDLIARIVNLMSRESVTVGGRLLDRRRPSNDPGHFFLADARHPGTLGQGLMARMFVEAVNARFGAGIPPLTDREVAGLTDTLAANPPGDPSIRLTSLAAYSVVTHVGQAARGTPRSLATLLPFPPVAAAAGPRGVGTVFHNPGEAFGDTDLAALGGGKFSYRMMDLSLTHVGDGGLASIAGRHGLDTLDLFGTKVGDRGLAYLAGLSGLSPLPGKHPRR
jgi:phospholipase/lecithinase/hemolysin